VHRALRRLAAPIVVVPVVLSFGGAGATWGASPGAHAAPRAPRAFEVSAPSTRSPQLERAESAVVLVAFDGVRWQDVFDGADRALTARRGLYPPAWSSPRALMPSLYRGIDRHGVAIGAPGHGAEVSVSGAQLISLPGYLELFAGHPDPACSSNECARPPARTIADDVLESSGPGDVAVVTSWPNVARAASADPSRFVLTSGRRRVERASELLGIPGMASMLDEGLRAGASPGEGDYRPDAFTAAIALRVLQATQPRFLFVGLGDADEYAHRGNYPRYLQALHDSDAFLGQLDDALAGMGERGRHTTVIVTTDHGRSRDFRDHGSRYPESARIWLVASGDDVRARGFADAARRYTLSDVAPTVRCLLGIDVGDRSPIAEIAGH